jgi:phenylalanyl-tRNA synthetase beta chain
MKFSYNWLKELVPGLAADAREVGRQITMKTAECEGVEPHGADWVIEIDNKSLTHRPDLWGHIGMAREVAAHFGLALKSPVDLSALPQGDPAVTVRIENLDLCPRFSAVLYEGVKVGPSPKWLQDRLEAIGINPINNIVDITNWVMAEIPQPMHAFDADKVASHTLIARAAKPGETCTALNGESYELDPSVIAVAGVDGVLAIAGVMGGESSMIGDHTSRVIFEAANWHPASVRKASTRLKLRTDASMRFEKALDPENTVQGLARAIALMRLCSPDARLVGGLADVYRPLIPPDPIELPLAWLAAKLGKTVETPEVAAILRSIGFRVTESPGVLTVTVPSWRATKDISIKDDLVEEVGRMIGYGSITPQPPRMAVTPARPNTVRKFQNFVRARMTDWGFDEVQNYSFVSDADAERFGFAAADHLRVKNPISEEQALLRLSLIPKIHANVSENRKHFEAFRLFEIGHEIHRRPGELPDEIPHLAAAIYAKDDGVASLAELKRVAAALAPGAEFRPTADARVFEHPARAANVLWRGETLGRLFEFHPKFVEQGRAAVLDLDLRKLQAITESRDTKYSPVGRFPSSTFDLAIVVGARALAGDVARAIPEAEFREEFRLPDGRRSLLFRFTLSAPDRTLTGDEIAAARQRQIEKLRALGYELRA